MSKEETYLEALKAVTSSLIAATSAYHMYAKRHPSYGQASVDAFFSTRVSDMNKAVDKAMVAIEATEGEKSVQSIAQTLTKVDWVLFRKQKAWLFMEEGDEAGGLMSFLDALQDAAILDGIVTEQEMFAKPNQEKLP